VTLPGLVDAVSLGDRLSDPDLVLVDATVVLHRPPGSGPYRPEPAIAAYDDGHLPGAVFADLVAGLADPRAPFPFAIPSPAAFAAAASGLGIGEGARVVVYSQESPMWATRLWWLLRYHGFDDVEILDGGLQAWRAAGLPLVTEAAQPRPRPFTSVVRPALLARRADVQAALAEGGMCLVNALSPEAFRGEGVTSYSRPGRIPGSVSIPARSLLDPVTALFRPLAELRHELAALLDPAHPVVLYCGGGISATVDAFALALLGRDDVRLYDGSLTEWSADPDLPLDLG
jgi:thiosulfate/3-mercaptopyruvate sulfurtransferase